MRATVDLHQARCGEDVVGQRARVVVVRVEEENGGEERLAVVLLVALVELEPVDPLADVGFA